MGRAVIRLGLKLACFCALVTLAHVWLQRPPQQALAYDEGQTLRVLAAARALR